MWTRVVKIDLGLPLPLVQVSGANLVVQNLALAACGGGTLTDPDPLRAKARAESYAPILRLAEARIDVAPPARQAARDKQVASKMTPGASPAANESAPATVAPAR